MTEDGSKGVILWTENINNLNQYIVRRLDFTVDNSGNLALGNPVTVLPLTGQEALPGDELYFFNVDIWGDANHDSLYLAVSQTHVLNSVPNVRKEIKLALIYDLNGLTDVNASPEVREIYNDDAGGWQDANGLDCASVAYPQFVPTCYPATGLRFNPSGTRTYMDDNVNDKQGIRWDGAIRMHINKTPGQLLADWTLTGPELVYTGHTTTNHTNAAGSLARPDADISNLPAPEYVAVVQRAGGAITEITSIMDADQCALDFAPYASGNLEGSPDLWFGCVDNSTFFGGNSPGSGSSWQSPDALLKSSFQAPGYDILRVYVSGGLAGTEQVLVESARFGDTGH